MIPVMLLHSHGSDRDSLIAFLEKRGHDVVPVETLADLRRLLVERPPVNRSVAVIHLLELTSSELAFLDDVPCILLGPTPDELPKGIVECLEEPYYLADVGGALDRVSAARRPRPTRSASVPDPTPSAEQRDLGAILRGISHALNNPLSAALGWVQLLETEVGPADPGHRVIGHIASELRRLEQLSTAVGVIGQRPGGARGPVELQPLVELRVARLRHEGLPIVLRAAKDVPSVLGDPVEFSLMLDLLFTAFLEERSRVLGIEVDLVRSGDGVLLRLVETAGTLPGTVSPDNLGLLLKGVRHSRALGIALAHAVIEKKLGGAVRLVETAAMVPALELHFPLAAHHSGAEGA